MLCSLQRDDNGIVYKNFQTPKQCCHVNEWPKHILVENILEFYTAGVSNSQIN